MEEVGLSFQNLLDSPIDIAISNLISELRLKIILNTKRDTLSFRNPSTTIVDFVQKEGRPYYSMQFEYASSQPSDHISQRIAVHIGTDVFKSFITVFQACPQQYSDKN